MESPTSNALSGHVTTSPPTTITHPVSPLDIPLPDSPVNSLGPELLDSPSTPLVELDHLSSLASPTSIHSEPADQALEKVNTTSSISLKSAWCRKRHQVAQLPQFRRDPCPSGGRGRVSSSFSSPLSSSLVLLLEEQWEAMSGSTIQRLLRITTRHQEVRITLGRIIWGVIRRQRYRLPVNRNCRRSR